MRSVPLPSDAERLVLAVWLMLMFLVSSFGDTTILIASIKYRAFKLSPIIVVFIEHIAVCDLLISFVSILTLSVSLMADGWVFGRHLCYAKVYLSFYGNNASVLFICGMTVSKLLMLRYPLKAQSWNRERTHIVCAAIWILSLTVPITFLIVDKDNIGYIPAKYSCHYKAFAPLWRILVPILTVLFGVIPVITVVTTSVLLVKHLLHAREVALRTNSTVRWQGIVTVILTAVVYCISYLPTALHMILVKIVKNEVYKGVAPRVVDTFMFFNVVANFIVYSFTVTSFRAFLMTRMKLISATFNTGNQLQD